MVSKDREIESRLKLILNVTKPDLEGVWLDGHECARTNESSLDQNPYDKNTAEYHSWEQGWWAGFYGEEVPALLESVNKVTHVEKGTSINDVAYDHGSKNRKVFQNTYKLVGSMLATVMAYEALDLVI